MFLRGFLLIFLTFLTPIALSQGSQLDQVWLNSRLARYEHQVQWWQYGWLSVHGAAALAGGMEANRTHSKADKRSHAVSAVAAALGGSGYSA